MESFSSTNCSKLDDDRAWSSQEWKIEATTYDRSRRPDKTTWRMVQKVRPDHEEILLDGTAPFVMYGEMLRDRSGRPDNINSQEVARPQNFIMGSDATELDLSVESRSFVNRVNDQVRKRQKRMSNVAGEGEEHSIIRWMFMAVSMECSRHSWVRISKTIRIPLWIQQISHWRKCSTYLRNWCRNKMRSQIWKRFVGKNISWKYLSSIGDERIINLQRAKVYVFSDSVLSLGKIHQHPECQRSLEEQG